MFTGRLLCTPDQIPFNFLSEWSNKNESKAPWADFKDPY